MLPDWRPAPWQQFNRCLRRLNRKRGQLRRRARWEQNSKNCSERRSRLRTFPLRTLLQLGWRSFWDFRLSTLAAARWRIEEVAKAADLVKAPLTAQMFVDMSMAQAKQSKVTVAVYATFLQNIQQGAMHEALTELKTTGFMTKAAKGQRLGQGMPADVRAKVFRTTDLTERGKKYHEA